jgi:hypothetical protein
MKTEFEFGLNLLEVQTSFKKSEKFHNFSFALIFQIVNLDSYGCMAKFEVSIQGPIDLD